LTDSTGQTAPSAGDAASSAPPGKRLKILVGADTFTPDVNGAARFGERLVSGLASRGHDVRVIAPSQTTGKYGTWTEEYDGQKIVMYRLPSYRWKPHDWLRFAIPWTLGRKAATILEDFEPDAVHFQSHFVVGRGLSTEARKHGIRIIATNHTMPDNLIEFTRIPKFLQRLAINISWRDTDRILSRAEAVTTPTRKAAQYLEKHTSLRGVRAISCGIDAHNYTPNFEPRTENRVLFVGRITGEKQIDILLRAIALLPDDLDAKLEIVGTGDQLKNLEQFAASLGLADRVTFTGYLSDDELRQAYTRATVLGMPSTAELQSIVTMEAMASGLPIVAADAMALPHLVHDGENGFLFEPGNAQAMADRLERVFRAGPVELDAMKNASLQLIEAHDIERTLNTFEKLYRGEPVSDPVMDAAPAVESSKD
jgi:glycosyltransferase involved in cell wall biosynthesis